MSTFVPRVTFVGYPVDDRSPVTFTKGQESIPVPEAFAQLMREKGLVADRRDSPIAKTRPKRVLKAPAPAVAKKLATAVKKRRTRTLTRRQSSPQD